MSAPAPDPELAADSTGLYDMATEVLDRVYGVFASAGVSLPDRRYVHVGAIAHDCEQVVATFRQAYIGPPGDEAATPQRCDGPRSAALEVHVIRCVPGPTARGGAPSVADMNESARTQLVDAWLLLDAASALDTWGMPSMGGLGVIATVEAGEPQGKFQAVVLNIAAGVPGGSQFGP